MPVLNNVNCPDQYDASGKVATISDVYPVPNGGGWFSLASNGNSAYVEIAFGAGLYGASSFDQAEEQVLGSGAYGTIPPGATGIRFRNAVAGKVAVVTAVLAPKGVPVLGVNSLGSVNVVTGSTLNFQRNDLAIASEPTADFMDPAANVFTWSLADDVPNTRVRILPVISNPAVFPGNVTSPTGDFISGGITVAVGASAGSLLHSTGTVASAVASTAGNCFTATVAGDTVGYRLTITGDGVIHWGPGNAALDASFGRVATSFVGGSSGVAITRSAASICFAAAVTADTVNRWTVDTSGSIQWGPGNAAADVGLFRQAAGAPSSGGTGLQSNQSIYCTSTQGFIYTAATNNAAFQSFLLASDANPAFKIFTQGALVWGPGGATTFDIEMARVVNSPSGTGSFMEFINGDAFGYGTGTGGAVTQLTNLSTGVTLNKPSGQITLFTSAISGGLVSSFTLTNSVIGAKDTVVLSWATGAAGINAGLIAQVSSIAAGSCVITHVNVSGASLSSGTRVLNFAVIKGASA